MAISFSSEALIQRPGPSGWDTPALQDLARESCNCGPLPSTRTSRCRTGSTKMEELRYSSSGPEARRRHAPTLGKFPVSASAVGLIRLGLAPAGQEMSLD